MRTRQRRGDMGAAGGTGMHRLVGSEEIESCLPGQHAACVPRSAACPNTRGRGWGSEWRGAAPRPAQRCTPSASHAPVTHSARAVAPSSETPCAAERVDAGSSHGRRVGKQKQRQQEPVPGRSCQDARVPPPRPWRRCLSFPTVEQAVGLPPLLQSCPGSLALKVFLGGAEMWQPP